MAFPQAQIQSGISRRPYMVSSKPDWNGTIHCSPISNLSAMLSPDMTHACMCVTRKISQSSTLTTYCCLFWMWYSFINVVNLEINIRDDLPGSNTMWNDIVAREKV